MRRRQSYVLDGSTANSGLQSRNSGGGLQTFATTPQVPIDDCYGTKTLAAGAAIEKNDQLANIFLSARKSERSHKESRRNSIKEVL